MAYIRFSDVEHGFSDVEHGLFSIFERRTWPVFDFRASNMSYFRFSSVEHILFSIVERRTWPIFDFESIYRLRAALDLSSLNYDQSGDSGISATLKYDQSGNFG